MKSNPIVEALDKDALLDALVKSSVDGFFICDNEQHILLHNPTFEKLLGFDKEVIRSSHLFNFFYLRKPITNSLRGKQLGKFVGHLQQWVGLNSLGNTYPCLVSINKVQHNDQDYFIGIVHDISSAEDTANSLKKEYSLLEKYLYITNSIIIELDEHARILTFNHKAEELTGYTAEEALGVSWFDLILPKAQIELFRTNWREIFKRKKELEEFFTHQIITKTGKSRVIRWHSIFNIKRDGSVASVLASGMDITALKEAERKLHTLNLSLEKEVSKRTQELVQVVNRLLSTNKKLDNEIAAKAKIQNALQQSQEELKNSLEKEMELNSLKSRFLSMASHEFRTPLAAILSSVSLLERYENNVQNEKKQKHFDRIKRSLHHITQMLDDFFSISNFEDGQISYSPIPINLHDFCMRVVDSFQDIMKAGQSLIYECQDESLEFQTDPKLLKNVLINLLSNASKYSLEGQPILLRARADEKNIYFEVIDEGVGIPASEQKYLFTRFFRAKNVSNIKGTGIGLNIVKEYLKLLEGEIVLKSELDKGSTFTVSIPKQKSYAENINH